MHKDNNYEIQLNSIFRLAITNVDEWTGEGDGDGNKSSQICRKRKIKY